MAEIGEVYRAKRIGPRTDPWGTPEVISERGEQASPILTDCRRLCRYEEIQSRARPVRPKQEERRLMRIL